MATSAHRIPAKIDKPTINTLLLYIPNSFALQISFTPRCKTTSVSKTFFCQYFLAIAHWYLYCPALFPECFCDPSEPPSSEKVPDQDCNQRCTGDSLLTCGGHWRGEVFELTEGEEAEKQHFKKEKKLMFVEL